MALSECEMITSRMEAASLNRFILAFGKQWLNGTLFSNESRTFFFLSLWICEENKRIAFNIRDNNNCWFHQHCHRFHFLCFNNIFPWELIVVQFCSVSHISVAVNNNLNHMVCSTNPNGNRDVALIDASINSSLDAEREQCMRAVNYERPWNHSLKKNHSISHYYYFTIVFRSRADGWCIHCTEMFSIKWARKSWFKFTLTLGMASKTRMNSIYKWSTAISNSNQFLDHTLQIKSQLIHCYNRFDLFFFFFFKYLFIFLQYIQI